MNLFKFLNGYAIGFEGYKKLYVKTMDQLCYVRCVGGIVYKDIWDGWINKAYVLDKYIPEYRFIKKKYLYQNIWKLKDYWENYK